MPNNQTLYALALIAFSIILTGCGGGGETANPFSPAETTATPDGNGGGDIPTDNGGNTPPSDERSSDGSPSGSGKLILKWNPDTEVSWYEVYYGKNADFTQMQLLTKAEKSSAHFNILHDLSVLPGDEVCFRVKAFSNVAESGFSDAVCTII